MASITLQGIEKSYGSAYALRALNLEVGDGEFLAVLGPSGSGKTTFLSLVAGLTAPTAGRVLIDGRDMTDAPPQTRRVGLVFQSYALFPHLSVFNNVAFPLAVRGLPRAVIRSKVDGALARVRLTGFEARRPTQLSGGQQQGVALARAIVFKPQILLLDGPLGALDRRLREEVQIELKTLQRDLGITTCLVTHDQEEALSLADRVLVLADGGMQQIGSPNEVYMRPATRFVAEFLGSANVLEGRVDSSGSLRLSSGEAVPCQTGERALESRAVAVVRPESIRLLPDSTNEGIQARVHEVIYLGHQRRWHVRTLGGSPIKVSRATADYLPEPGGIVRVAWTAEDAWLLPEEGAGIGSIPQTRPPLTSTTTETMCHATL